MYSPQAKKKLCEVNEVTISTYGTVSSQIATEMAERVKKELSAGVGVAITGVAGESIEGKPPGLVYISISSHKGDKAEEFHFKGLRRKIKEQAVLAALTLLLQL